MHILFITDNYPPEVNAAASRVYERACYWRAWGCEVTVVTCAPNFPQGKVYSGYKNKWYDVALVEGIRVVRVKSYIHANTGTIQRIVDFVSFGLSGFYGGVVQKKIDIVIATSPQFFSAVAGWAIGRARRIPFIFELGDLWPSNLKALGVLKSGRVYDLFEAVELFLYRQSKAVVSLTHAFKRDLIRRGIKDEKIRVIQNGVDLKRYSPIPKNRELEEKWGLSNKFVVGYLGTHGMAHQLDNAINTASLVSDIERLQFLFVGEGACKADLVEQAHSAGLENVVFQPSQKKELMPQIWSLCDVALVHLRDHQDFATVIPSKIFEAWAMGLPVLLVAPEGEATELVRESKAGIVVPVNDPTLLADAVRKLMRDKDQVDELKSNSLTAAPKHSRELQARKMLDVIEEMVAE